MILRFLFASTPYPIRISVVAGMVLASMSSARTKAQSEVRDLPDVMVTATQLSQPIVRVPHAISQLNQNEIQWASAQLSLDEPLQTVPGVFVLNPTNFAQDSRISIRGFGSRATFGIRGIRLFQDGIPATMPDGQGSVDSFDLGSTDRIQIFRGPASALYGASSGGVILLETESGPDIPFAEARWTTGSYALNQLQVKTGGQIQSTRALLSGTALEWDGYREHSETESRKWNTKVEVPLSKLTDLTVVANTVDLPLQNDPGGLTQEEAEADPSQARQRNVDYNSGESVEQVTLGMTLEHAVTASHRIEANAYTLTRDFENLLPFENGGQVAFDREVVGLSGRVRFQRGASEAVIGIQGDLQQDDRVRYDNLSGVPGPLALDQQEQIGNLGVSAVGSTTWEHQVTLFGAVRQDTIRYDVEDAFLADGDDSGTRDLNETSPMIGVSWEWTEEQAVYANLSRTFTPPTSTELANPTGGGFNPDLNPQTARGAEIGMKGRRLGWGDRMVVYELAAFQIDIEDAIVPFELASSPGRTYFRNAGESERLGVEAALRMDLSPHLTLDLSATWSEFTYSDFTSGREDVSGNLVPGVPEFFGNLQLNYRHPSGLSARWNTRTIGEMQANDANTETVEDSVVSDLRLSIEWQKEGWTLEPYLGVNNIFNESYFANIRINAFGGRYYEPAPDRNVFGGIRLRVEFF